MLTRAIPFFLGRSAPQWAKGSRRRSEVVKHYKDGPPPDDISQEDLNNVVLKHVFFSDELLGTDEDWAAATSLGVSPFGKARTIVRGPEFLKPENAVALQGLSGIARALSINLPVEAKIEDVTVGDAEALAKHGDLYGKQNRAAAQRCKALEVQRREAAATAAAAGAAGADDDEAAQDLVNLEVAAGEPLAEGGSTLFRIMLRSDQNDGVGSIEPLSNAVRFRTSPPSKTRYGTEKLQEPSATGRKVCAASY